MAEINTVSLSGVVSGDVEIRKAKDLEVARFFIEVEGAGERRSHGKFMVVAFAEWAEVARKLSEGDRLVLVGALSEWRGKGMRDVEVRVRNLIPLPKRALDPDQWEVTSIIDEIEDELEDGPKDNGEEVEEE